MQPISEIFVSRDPPVFGNGTSRAVWSPAKRGKFLYFRNRREKASQSVKINHQSTILSFYFKLLCNLNIKSRDINF